MSLVKKRIIPLWLQALVGHSLLCEVYPELRGVAISFDSKKKLTVYFYLYREPTEFDYESANIIMDNIVDHSGSFLNINGERGLDIEEYSDKCIYDNSPIRDLDSLDGFIYLRREYDMEDNPK